MNTPVFGLWLIDRAIFGNLWRRTQPQVYSRKISDDYMLLCWNQACSLQASPAGTEPGYSLAALSLAPLVPCCPPSPPLGPSSPVSLSLTLTKPVTYVPLQTVGPKFFFRLLDSGFFERAHVVTGFERRIANVELPGVPTESIGHHFTSAAVIRVYHKKRAPSLCKRDTISHTHRMQAAVEQHPLHVWGPFIDDVRAASLHFNPRPAPWQLGMARGALALYSSQRSACACPPRTQIGQQVVESLRGEREVCLVASGSAVCYLLDALQHKLLVGGDGTSVTLLYTCRDAELFGFVVKLFQNVLLSRPACDLSTLRVILSLTDGGGKLKLTNTPVFERESAWLRDRSPQLLELVPKRKFSLLDQGTSPERKSLICSTGTLSSDASPQVARLQDSSSPGSRLQRPPPSRPPPASYPPDEETAAPTTTESAPAEATSATLSVLYSRIDWEEAIPPGCVLFAQGAGGVLKQAAAMGRKKACNVVIGPVYDSEVAAGRNSTGFLHKAKQSTAELLCLDLCCPRGAPTIARVMPYRPPS